MAEREPDINDVGTFVTKVAIGYVLPPEEAVGRILHALQRMAPQPSQRMLRDLLTIKLLVPRESAEVVIYGIPEVAHYIHQTREALVQRYYDREGQ